MLVGACTRGARVHRDVAPCRQRAHRSVEGGSELDASRAWASPKDVCRAFDDAGTVDGCCEHIHNRRRWGVVPVEARVGLGWGHGTHTACRGENLVKDLAK